MEEKRKKLIDRAVEIFGELTQDERQEVLKRLDICTHCMREFVNCSGWCDYPGTPVD